MAHLRTSALPTTGVVGATVVGMLVAETGTPGSGTVSAGSVVGSVSAAGSVIAATTPAGTGS